MSGLPATVVFDNPEYVEILDQTLLPGREEFLKIGTLEASYEAIYKLRVRGAPAIGVFGACAMACYAGKIDAEDYMEFVADYREASAYLDSSRPTAVNLSWALKEQMKIVESNNQVSKIKTALVENARRILSEDAECSRKIGEIGAELIKPGFGILTHCNAGQLATIKYGTATAPMYIAKEKGIDNLRIYCDETRPLLQGARLTSYELYKSGFDVTLLCDDMSASLMKSGAIDIIFVGADRIAANGDTANKIGTMALAISAKHFGVPFYVCAPSSTLDNSLATGDDIPIEFREEAEVSKMWYSEPMAPEGVKVYNPAFDVTDHSLITGIITEKGIRRF